MLTRVVCPTCKAEVITFTAVPHTRLTIQCGLCQAHMLVTDDGVALRKLAVPEIADLNKVKISTIKSYRARYTDYAERIIAEYHENISLVQARCDRVLSAASDKLRKEQADRARLEYLKVGVKPAYVGKTGTLPPQVMVDMLCAIIDGLRLPPAEVLSLKGKLTTLAGCRAVGRRFGIQGL